MKAEGFMVRTMTWYASLGRSRLATHRLRDARAALLSPLSRLLARDPELKQRKTNIEKTMEINYR